MQSTYGKKDGDGNLIPWNYDFMTKICGPCDGCGAHKNVKYFREVKWGRYSPLCLDCESK